MMIRIVKAKPGYAINSLARSKVRNFLCPCGSMKKVKKCCGRFTTVDDEMDAKIRPMVYRADEEEFERQAHYMAEMRKKQEDQQ